MKKLLFILFLIPFLGHSQTFHVDSLVANKSLNVIRSGEAPFEISQRLGFGFTFPVVSLRAKNTNIQTVFDLMPNGTAPNNWIDVCNVDFKTTNAVGQSTRLGVTSTYTELGSYHWNGAGKVPLYFTLDGSKIGQLDTTRVMEADWFRVTGTSSFASPPTARRGLEFDFDSTANKGYIFPFNRVGSVYLPLLIDGIDISLNSLATGSVLIGSSTNHSIAKEEITCTACSELGLFYNSSNYAQFQVGSDGHLVILPSGVNVTLAAPTTSHSTLTLPAGTYPSSPNQGDLGAVTGHLYYRDGSTTYDLLASGASMAIGGAVSSGTPGSVLYIDASNKLGQDNSNFFYDATNKRLGIGINSPSNAIHLSSSLPVVQMTDNTGNNSAYVSNYQDYALWSVNRDLGTGVFKNTSKAASQIELYGSTSIGRIIFQTTNTNNLLPPQVASFEGNGDFLLGSSTDHSTGIAQFSSNTNYQTTLHYDATHYTQFFTDASGILNITPTGSTLSLHYDPSHYTTEATSSAGVFSAQSTGNTYLINTATNNSTGTVQILSGSSNQLALHYDNSHFVGFLVSSTGNLSIIPNPGNTVTFPHFEGVNVSIPTTTGLNGSVSSATVSAGSTDNDLTVTVVTSGSITAGTTLFTLTYNSSFSTTPKPLISGQNAASAAIAPYVVGASASTATVGTGGNIVGANTYVWTILTQR